LATRRFFDVRDAFFVDSGSTYDVPINISGVTAADPVVVTTSANHNLSDGDQVDIHDILWEPNVDSSFNETQPAQLNGNRFRVADATSTTFSVISNEQNDRVDISAVTQADPGVVTTLEDHGLSDGDVIAIFNVSGMTSLNGNTYKVANSTDDTFELTTLADADVDTSGYSAYTSGGQIYPAIDGSAFNAYKESGTVREAVLTVTGAWHLEGITDAVALCDGEVVEDITVANGSVTFDRRYSRVHLGRRIIADVETLPPESGRGTVQGKDLRTPYVALRLKDTRGLLVGPDSSSLVELAQREDENYGEPTTLENGDVEIEIFSDWASQGKVFIRQIYPLPMTISAIMPNIEEGDDDEE